MVKKAKPQTILYEKTVNGVTSFGQVVVKTKTRSSADGRKVDVKKTKIEAAPKAPPVDRWHAVGRFWWENGKPQAEFILTNQRGRYEYTNTGGGYVPTADYNATTTDDVRQAMRWKSRPAAHKYLKEQFIRTSKGEQVRDGFFYIINLEQYGVEPEDLVPVTKMVTVSGDDDE